MKASGVFCFCYVGL